MGVVSLQHLLQLLQALCLDPAQLAFGLAIGEHERLFKLLTQKREIAGPLTAGVTPRRNGVAQTAAFRVGEAAHRGAQRLVDLGATVVEQLPAALLKARQRVLQLTLDGLQLLDRCLGHLGEVFPRQHGKLVPGGVFTHPRQVAERLRHARQDAADMTVGGELGQSPEQGRQT